MLLSYAVHLLGDRPLSERLNLLVHAGFDGVDLPASALTDPDTRPLLADSGLPVGAVYSQVRDPGLLSARNHERATAIDQIVERAEAAAAVGAANLIVVPIFGAAKLPEYASVVDQRTMETAILLAGLAELAERVRDLPITITLEPLNPAETHFLTDPAVAARLCAAVDSPRIATMVDTYHADLCGQDLPATIDAVGDHLALVHLSDTDRALPGIGTIDFAAVIEALSRRNYTGWLGLECKYGGDDEAIGRSVRQLWSIRAGVDASQPAPTEIA